VVPWTYRGKRGSDPIQRGVVRRNARWLPSRNPTRSTSLLASLSEINTNLMGPPSLLRTASGALDADASHGAATASNSGPGPQRTLPYRASTVSAAKENDVGALVGDVPELPGKWVLPEEDQRCESPVPMFQCTGWCREPDRAALETEAFSGGVKADVISLASCKDSQLTYEDGEGKSMTSSLVEILRCNPNQSLKDLLVSVSHAVHNKAVVRHENAKKYKKAFADGVVEFVRKKKAEGRRTMSLVIPERQKVDMDNFQNPELASARPLDMDRLFLL